MKKKATDGQVQSEELVGSNMLELETVKYCTKCDKVHPTSNDCIPLKTKLFAAVGGH